jgi:hypothetical protein
MKLFYVLGVFVLLWSVASAGVLSSDSESAAFDSKQSHDRDSSEERGPCKAGTIYDDDTHTCVPCPTGSIQTANRCYCPSTHVLDENTNACRECPSDATRVDDDDCECISTSLFFSEKDWTCKTCPGTLVPPRVGHRRYTCRCTGANEIFYEDHAICYTCPTGTTADSDNDDCDCAPGTDLEFDYATGKCACEHGKTLNEFGACTRSIP